VFPSVKDDLKYLLALRFASGIGDITARRLLSAFHSPADIFSASKKSFLSVEGTTGRLYSILQSQVDWAAVDREMSFIHQHNVQVVSVLDDTYPPDLAACYDAPFLFFCKGRFDTSDKKIISIVGTRSATGYGKQVCRELVEGLASFRPVIVSGLAYGVDITAHKTAMDCGLETYAVVAHGLHTIYPHAHRACAGRIVESGCLISEFPWAEGPDRENFPRRNRIIAGLSQATVVVEASEKGGALITAKIAASYNREVFAFPGRSIDRSSSGCNRLIKNNEAMMIESAADLVKALGWDDTLRKPAAAQKKFFADLDEDELSVMRLLEQKGNLPVDDLAVSLGLSLPRLASLLLLLEMKGAVASLPGKMYRLL